MILSPLTICLLSSSLLRQSGHSFSVVSPPTTALRQPLRPTSTCLWSEQEGAAEASPDKEEETPAGDESATDILSSPAFLKRKLEVLKNDMLQAEEDLQDAKKRLEAGKAEWGAQLEELQKEVRKCR